MTERKDGLALWLPDEVPPEQDFCGIDRTVSPAWGWHRISPRRRLFGRTFWSAWDRARDFMEARRWR